MKLCKYNISFDLVVDGRYSKSAIREMIQTEVNEILGFSENLKIEKIGQVYMEEE